MKNIKLSCAEKNAVRRIRENGFYDPLCETLPKIRAAGTALSDGLVQKGVLTKTEDGVYELHENWRGER